MNTGRTYLPVLTQNQVTETQKELPISCQWVDETLVKPQTEVSIVPYPKSKFRSLPLSDPRVVHGGNQRREGPTPGSPRVTSAMVPLMKVVNWDGTSQDIEQALASAFEAEDYLDCVKNLGTQDVQSRSYINILDKVSSCPTPKRRTLNTGIYDRSSIRLQLIQTCESDAYER